MAKLLDLRFVIGIFFLILGIILLGYSFLNMREHTINRWCGVSFIIFSIVMILLSFHKDAADELLSEKEKS
jgi:uncharacterized membrane protein HdeD (DUF308 family)